MGVYYVDQLYGNDANNGTSPSTPKLTIASALAVSDATHRTIYVRNDNATPVSAIHFSSTHNYLDCTLIGCAPDSSLPGQWTPASGDARPLVTVSDSSEGTIINTRNTYVNSLQRLRFVNAAFDYSGRGYIRYIGSGTASLEAIQCDFLCHMTSASTFFLSSTAISAPASRTAVFKDCTIRTADATNGRLVMQPNEWAELILDGVQIEQGSAVTGPLIGPLGSSLKRVSITKSTLAARFIVDMSGITATQSGSVLRLVDNTLTGQFIVRCYRHFGEVILERNLIHQRWFNQNATAISVGAEGESDESVTVGRVVMVNNVKVSESGTVAGAEHYVYIGFGTKGLICYNKFVQSAALNDHVYYGIVIKGADVFVFNNQVACKLPLYAVSCQRCVFAQNIAVCTSAGLGGAAFGLTVSGGSTRKPSRNAILNNIFVGCSGAKRVFAGLAGGTGPTYWAATDERHLVDYNCYFCEGSGPGVALFQLEHEAGAGMANDLAGIRDIWAANANSYAYPMNDTSTEIYNPMIGGMSADGWTSGNLTPLTRPPVTPANPGQRFRLTGDMNTMPYPGSGQQPTQIRYVTDQGIEVINRV